MESEIDEIIKAGVVFSSGKIIPKWFLWKNRKYDIKEVNYTWNDYDGTEKLLLFSVTDGTNNYEISFNTKRTIWKINKVWFSLDQ